jgi:hypothetical protein
MYVPKHRNAPPKRARVGAKNAVLYSGVAVLATSLSVGAGVVAHKNSSVFPTVSLSAGKAPLTTSTELSQRTAAVSRSDIDRISQATSLKAAELSSGNGVAVTHTEDLSLRDPKALARALMPQYGLSSADFECVNEIWTQESNWNVHAANPTSSAYGIPQSLPGSKMATVGADWRNNPETQIRWGLNYIAKRYGTACSAWAFKQSHGYY